MKIKWKSISLHAWPFLSIFSIEYNGIKQGSGGRMDDIRCFWQQGWYTESPKGSARCFTDQVIQKLNLHSPENIVNKRQKCRQIDEVFPSFRDMPPLFMLQGFRGLFSDHELSKIKGHKWPGLTSWPSLSLVSSAWPATVERNCSSRWRVSQLQGGRR